MQVGHGRVQREEAIEAQPWCRSIEAKRIVAPQCHPVGVADGRHRGKPVKRAAQYDDEEPRIVALRACNLWQVRPGEQYSGSEQELAAGRGVGVAHCHLRWNSGAMNRSVRACGRLSARRIAVRVSSLASGPSAVSSACPCVISDRPVGCKWPSGQARWGPGPEMGHALGRHIKSDPQPHQSASPTDQY